MLYVKSQVIENFKVYAHGSKCSKINAFCCFIDAILEGIEAMVFPVVMYGCESWTIKNAEC